MNATELPSLSDAGLAPIGDLAEYTLVLATTEQEVEEAQRLRFEVFNLELKEGLETSAALGLDVDPFDAVCEHLLVRHKRTQQVIGTYRLQTGAMAAAQRGYYSAQEFDFTPYEKIRTQIIELGRACVHRDHRNLSALHLLWRGIAWYARKKGGRYLMGCSSLTSQDSRLGIAMYQRLAPGHLVAPELRTQPQSQLALDDVPPLRPFPAPPKLLRAYLALGAKICGPPALDREFKTIDFLTLLDLESLPSAVRNHFLS